MKIVSFWDLVKYESSRLLPAYFASVMATGIVSIASYLYHFYAFAYALFYFNNVLYASLWFLTIVRWIFYPKTYIDELKNFSRAPGFFTAVVGTNTLGSQYVILLHNYSVAYGLFVFGFILWFFYQYIILTAQTLAVNEKPSLSNVNGAWELWVVSTQSIAVLGAFLSVTNSLFYLIGIIAFFMGSAQYLIMTTMISFRMLFEKLEPKDITGPYWILMGATAITTLAGDQLLFHISYSNFKQQIANLIEPSVLVMTLLIWSIGTWWIPWIIIAGIWRHGIGKIPILTYDPQFWGAVFPMGMYTVSTFLLVKYTGFSPLMIIPNIFIYIAILAWFYEAGGMVYNFFKKVLFRKIN